MIRSSIRSFRRFLLDRMVLRPSRHQLDYGDQRRETFVSNGKTVECFQRKNYLGDEAPELLVLKFPGTGGRGERSTEFPGNQLRGIRTSQWTWNPPGYGGSEGRAKLDRIADAALDFWAHALHQDAGKQTAVWLCGNSLGCVTALHVAATLQPDPRQAGIVLRNPPPLVSVVKRVALQYPLGSLIGPVAESLHDSMNALVTASRSFLPAVFLQSELDSLVPVDHQNEIISTYAGPHQVVLMKGLGHGGVATEFHEPAIRASLGWLWERTQDGAWEDVSGESLTTAEHER